MGAVNDNTEPQPDIDRGAVAQQIETVAVALADPPMSRMAWRFYAAFFLYQDLAPFTAKELRELIGASSGSASTALRELEKAGRIMRTRPPGERADVYDLVDENEYGRNYAANMRRPLAALTKSLQVLPEGSRAWLRVRSMIDLSEFVAERYPELLAEWVRERAHIFGR